MRTSHLAPFSSTLFEPPTLKEQDLDTSPWSTLLGRGGEWEFFIFIVRPTNARTAAITCYGAASLSQENNLDKDIDSRDGDADVNS